MSVTTRSMSILSNELQDYLEKLIEPLAKSVDINKILNKLQEQETKICREEEIEVLESSLKLKEHYFNILNDKLDDLEQYTRRHSVRINGVKVDSKNKNESIPFDSNEINRAHRVGKIKTDKDSNMQTHSIIVQFRNWNSRCPTQVLEAETR